jgi:MFS transporter, DHA2 family, multidrug resistance protein
MADDRIQGSKTWITVAVMCAALMAVLDISIVNVALSDISASFGTPLDQIAWVSTGYMMANVVIIPMTGWLQRRFGFRAYFTGSILLFTLASVLCGTAWNLPSLVLFRVLQGMGGGAIIPTAQSILFARYPKKEHTMAGALFGLGAVTGPLLGPTVGGYLIEISGWHWIFLINVPIGLTAAALSWKHIEEPAWKKPDEKIDGYGIGLLAVGMASLQYVLEEGNRHDWLQSTEILVLACIAGVALITFFVHELEVKNPVVDLRIFKNRSYTAATGVNFLLGVALFGASYLFSLYCGAVMHYTALDIGTVFLVAGVAQIIMMPLVGVFGARFDGRLLLAVGVVLTSYSLYMTTQFTNQASFWNLAAPRVVQGLGMSLIFIPLSVLALSDLSAEKRGNATGLFNLTRELGGSIGLAWMGMQLSNGTRINAAHLKEKVDVYSPIAQEQLQMMQGVGSRTVDAQKAGLQLLDYRINLQALIKTFNHAFMLTAIGFACALVLVLLLKRADPNVKIEGAH